MSSVVLRPYQERGVAALVRCRRGIGWSPAGSGKTIIGAAAIARVTTKPMIIPISQTQGASAKKLNAEPESLASSPIPNPSSVS